MADQIHTTVGLESLRQEIMDALNPVVFGKASGMVAEAIRQVADICDFIVTQPNGVTEDGWPGKRIRDAL